MSNINIGSGILFGFPGADATTITGLGTLKLVQSEEVNVESDEEAVRDGSGNTAQLTKHDHRRKATLEFVCHNNTTGGTLTVSSWPSAGSTLAITDAQCAPMGATWLVDSLTLTRSNTAAMRARISLSRYISNSIP